MLGPQVHLSPLAYEHSSRWWKTESTEQPEVQNIKIVVTGLKGEAPTLLQIKNTFIHLDVTEARELSRATSAPAFAKFLVHEETLPEKRIESNNAGKMLTAHVKGDCTPCAYFHFKSDGCRKGDSCEFCHLCDKDTAKGWLKRNRQGRRRYS
eukprot:gb/GFBE01007839.1/.p1 GENE.gb/GFBE01007839.1/~~gb/GFBE01007839.1/.p1  ORF type:complete len:152 (+),score=26.98 gb/GFBE01007839.1/:1-456(+)